MKTLFILLAAGAAGTLPLSAQQQGNTPIYRVTVVERTVKAINYQYRSGPTQIDFRGTVLLPRAKGEAIVESRQGRTEIDASLENMTAPQRFGAEYLTYVLWAITPEGSAHNIGELIPGSSDHVKIRVTTDLQAFALIVTAEPYSAVHQPSDVVVAENQVRPDTVGIIKPVEARYELLPRGEYTWHVPSDLGNAEANSPKVSMHEYDALVELYQAQNAIGIAVSANAERYAPDMLARARQMLDNAQQMQDHHGDYRRVVQNAREAAQTAEDARVVARRLQSDEQLKAANQSLEQMRAALSAAEQEKEKASAEAREAQARATSAEDQAQKAMAARDQAEAEAAQARELAEQAKSKPLPSQETLIAQTDTTWRQARLRLLNQLKGALPTLDTGRGLVATVPDDAFRNETLADSSYGQVTQLARVLAAHPDLRVSVEGYSDRADGQETSAMRAEAVRMAMIRAGLAPGEISAHGLGNSRPVASSATAQGRRDNSRVEIVIAGNSIGHMPLWEEPTVLSVPARPTQVPR